MWRSYNAYDEICIYRVMYVVIIITDHKSYDYAAILDAAEFIFDTRNAMGELAKGNKKVERL